MFGWELKMEAKYMAMEGFIYDDAIGLAVKRPKGCFAKLFTGIKNAKVKHVKRVGLKAHGTIIKLHRSKEELTKENRCKKRKKGNHPWFLCHRPWEGSIQPHGYCSKKDEKRTGEKGKVLLFVCLWL